MQKGNLYTILFAVAVCGVFSIAVAVSAVGLKDRQEKNKIFDRIKNVLSVSGLMEPGADLDVDEVMDLFSTRMELRVIDLAATKEEADRQAPVYLLKRDGAVEAIILPVEGKGLWSTLYGYLALDRDTTTIRGITFYEHGETPGLGGEVDNMRWKKRWEGRKAFDGTGTPRIEVIKGPAGSPADDPFRVDGLSGATLTSRGVTELVRFWLGDQGYGPFLKRFREEGGMKQ